MVDVLGSNPFCLLQLDDRLVKPFRSVKKAGQFKMASRKDFRIARTPGNQVSKLLFGLGQFVVEAINMCGIKARPFGVHIKIEALFKVRPDFPNTAGLGQMGNQAKLNFQIARFELCRLGE